MLFTLHRLKIIIMVHIVLSYCSILIHCFKFGVIITFVTSNEIRHSFHEICRRGVCFCGHMVAAKWGHKHHHLLYEEGVDGTQITMVTGHWLPLICRTVGNHFWTAGTEGLCFNKATMHCTESSPSSAALVQWTASSRCAQIWDTWVVTSCTCQQKKLVWRIVG